MTFDEWYEKQYNAIGYDGERQCCREAWLACKQEVLRIINDGGHRCSCDYDHGAITEEVEKL